MTENPRGVVARVVTKELSVLMLNIPCSWCQAGAGEPCRNEDGITLQTEDGPVLAHISRIAPIWVVYNTGHRHGRQAMKREMEHDRNRV